MNRSPTDAESEREWLINQVAHALRNPLFAAQMQAQALILQAGSSPQTAAPGQALDQQLARFGKMIDEMLLYGRPWQLELSEINIEALLREVAAKTTSIENADHAEIEIDVDDRAQTLVCDPTALANALERIMINALQYSEPPQAITIVVEIESTDIAIRVQDRGTGMSPEMAEKATLPFYPQHRGRPGLGLAIAQKMIETHGGSLTLVSSEGRGTNVICTLPVRSTD